MVSVGRQKVKRAKRVVWLKEGRDGSQRRERRKDERSNQDGAQERSRLDSSVSCLSLTPEPPLTGS